MVVKGKLPRGCQLCIKGQKLVLFITGLCNKNCYYCTISAARWQKDQICANERKVKGIDDAIEEAKICRARGAGITGGEPLMRLNRTLEYIRAFKETFGQSFHIHLYTNGTLAHEHVLEKLYSAGLDEIRIHLDKSAVERALKFDWKVGMEVPCIPGTQRELCTLVDYLEQVGAHFLNLNEMEFSDRNVQPMLAAGFKLKGLTAVEGSARTAKAVLEHAREHASNLNIHFCTAQLKLDYQLRNRLARRARSIRKPFEKVTRNGFLLKGVVYGPLKVIASDLKRLGVKYMFINKAKGRVEISPTAAKFVAKRLKYKVAIVQEYPSAEPWDWEKTPLN